MSLHLKLFQGHAEENGLPNGCTGTCSFGFILHDMPGRAGSQNPLFQRLSYIIKRICYTRQL